MGLHAAFLLAKNASLYGAAGILADGPFLLEADHSGGTAADLHGLPPNRSAPAESENKVYARL
jgi:hypothetical protein